MVGLELGADVYLSKPFGLRELVVRIRAVLRRQGHVHHMSRHAYERGRFRFSGWELDRRARRLQDPSGTMVIDEDVFDPSIDVRIMRLRRKLETDANAARIIRSERGADYVFDLPVEHL